jgi:hypothetical protein
MRRSWALRHKKVLSPCNNFSFWTSKIGGVNIVIWVHEILRVQRLEDRPINHKSTNHFIDHFVEHFLQIPWHSFFNSSVPIILIVTCSHHVIPILFAVSINGGPFLFISRLVFHMCDLAKYYHKCGNPCPLHGYAFKVILQLTTFSEAIFSFFWFGSWIQLLNTPSWVS